ncbi:hypothetical protein COOONC_19270 [Cooperia oncophora]
MLDADIDWENSAFAGLKRRHDKKLKSESDGDNIGGDDIEMKKRKFDGQIDDNLEEMLPIKLKDYSGLSATELLGKRKELLAEFKLTISTYAHQLHVRPSTPYESSGECECYNGHG